MCVIFAVGTSFAQTMGKKAIFFLGGHNSTERKARSFIEMMGGYGTQELTANFYLSATSDVIDSFPAIQKASKMHPLPSPLAIEQGLPTFVRRICRHLYRFRNQSNHKEGTDAGAEILKRENFSFFPRIRPSFPHNVAWLSRFVLLSNTCAKSRLSNFCTTTNVFPCRSSPPLFEFSSAFVFPVRIARKLGLSFGNVSYFSSV